MTIDRYIVLDEKNIVKEIVNCDDSKNKDSVFSTKDILEKFFPERKIIKESKKTGIASVGSFYYKNSFTMPSPYPSWVWDGNKWVAPKEYPENNKVNFWNEKTKNWEIFEEE